MKSRFMLTALAVITGAIIDAGNVSAATYYFTQGASTSWTNSSNWFTACSGGAAGAVPGVNDQAVICPAKNANYDEPTNTTIRALDIREGAVVDFDNNSRSLTITDPGGLHIRHRQDTQDAEGVLDFDTTSNAMVVLSGGGVHVIDGKIWMRDTDTSTAILRVSATARLAGVGRIVGEASNANRLEVATDVTLTNEIKIEGRLKITEPSANTGNTFINDGVVLANSPTAGDILLLEEITFAQGSGVYKVDEDADAKMQIANSANCVNLKNDFLVKLGTLDADVDLITAGTLYYLSGTIDCAQDCVFRSAVAQ